MFSLLAATSEECRQLLSSSAALCLAAKTQIYSQEVAFNCHFFTSVVRRCSPGISTAAGESAAAQVLYYSALLLLFRHNEILQFLLLVAFRVHNPSWLRNETV